MSMTPDDLERYYSESYPMASLLPPVIVPSTGATAGIPGTWSPAGSTPPANITALKASAVVASPTTAWTTGQYVQTGTAGAGGRGYWDGTAWQTGAAP